jgi:hypothetical protein
MDLVEIVKILRRRVWLVLPMMTLTLAAAGGAFVYLPTTYESTSTVSLLNAPVPRPSGAVGQDNPFLMFDSSLTATADYLSRSLTAEASKQELKAMGVTEEFTSAFAQNAQGPFVQLTVTGPGKDHVLASTRTLTAYAATKLRTIQEANGVKESDMIRMTQIIPPQDPEPQLKDKLKIVLGIAGAGIAATLALTFVMESLRRSRGRDTTPPGSLARLRALDAVPMAPVVVPMPEVLPMPGGPTPRPPVAGQPVVAGAARGESDVERTLLFPLVGVSDAWQHSGDEASTRGVGDQVDQPGSASAALTEGTDSFFLIGPRGPVPLNGQSDTSPSGS